MAFFDRIKYLFQSKKDGTIAEQRLDDDKPITFKPRSDRFTYGNRADMNYDKNWKPTTAEERKTLSPEGYFRPEAGKASREEIKNGAEVPDRGEFFKQFRKDFFRKQDEENEDKEERKQISVDSTAIKKFDYDPKTESLTVQFQGGKGKKYFYPNVPKEKVKELVSASSKGEYFMANIHDQYSLNPTHKAGKHSEKYYDWFKKAYLKSKKNGGKK